VKVTLVPSSVSPEGAGQVQFLTSYLIGESLAIDAGCIGLYRTPREQARIKHVLLTHTHMDHIASLPTFLENVYDSEQECVTIHGSEAVLESLRRDLFNDRVWPDFIAMSAQAGEARDNPFLKLATLHPGQKVRLEGLSITPIAVNHIVPTLGFLIEDAASAVLIPSDTGPTEEIWRRANQAANLKAVFLETCFPDSMSAMAERAKHLTPTTFAKEVQKLRRPEGQGPVRLIAIHVKPLYYAQVVGELQALALPNLTMARFGEAYEF
jgi:ribonuclease BN (tRNA processing enzyme)